MQLQSMIRAMECDTNEQAADAKTLETIIREYAERLVAGERHAGRKLQLDVDAYLARHRDHYGLPLSALPGWCKHVADR